ncbi:MAG TPA: (deoxy)nucleoside triphosphate pyrophosphohydrolase [Myxococcaceae bacterium]|nr:(deoxy)nucleoside triphosphate pyrophosphohydrolase [Myxococcaceae bacterium]
MSPPPRRSVRVVAALIAHPEDGGRFLVQQRLPGGSRGLLWEFPGGKVEAGETDAQALARESREELAVDVSVGERVWDGRHAYPDLEVSLVLYRAKVVSGTPTCLGARQLRYLNPGEMRALPFCEADLPLIELLEAGALG